jgi:hypothetical protein
LPAALFKLLEEPGVPAAPKLLPVVPWLFALLALAPGAPPVPFTVTPLLSVVPDPDDAVEAEGEEPPAALPDEPPDDPPADPPPEPAPCADGTNSANAARSTMDAYFMADSFALNIGSSPRDGTLVTENHGADRKHSGTDPYQGGGKLFWFVRSWCHKFISSDRQVRSRGC